MYFDQYSGSNFEKHLGYFDGLGNFNTNGSITGSSINTPGSITGYSLSTTGGISTNGVISGSSLSTTGGISTNGLISGSSLSTSGKISGSSIQVSGGSAIETQGAFLGWNSGNKGEVNIISNSNNGGGIHFEQYNNNVMKNKLGYFDSQGNFTTTGKVSSNGVAIQSGDLTFNYGNVSSIPQSSNICFQYTLNNIAYKKCIPTNIFK